VTARCGGRCQRRGRLYITRHTDRATGSRAKSTQSPRNNKGRLAQTDDPLVRQCCCVNTEQDRCITLGLESPKWILGLLHSSDGSRAESFYLGSGRLSQFACHCVFMSTSCLPMQYVGAQLTSREFRTRSRYYDGRYEMETPNSLQTVLRRSPYALLNRLM